MDENMAAQIERVQLNANDTVAAIKDRLSFIRGRRVLLIWPQDGKPLTRKLDLVLIQREAHRRAIQLAIASADADVIRHASALNISAFETIEASQRKRWKRGRQKVFLPRYHKPRHEPEPEELKSIASRLSQRSRRQSRLRYLLERLIVLILLIGALAMTAYIVLPGALVVVILQENEINITIDITADAALQSVDIDQAIIPAQILRASIETTAAVPTTGAQRLENAPARGLVTFTNQTNAPVDIPPNTSLTTSAGAPVLFRTVRAVTVPAGIGRHIDAPVEAMPSSTGAVGNVDAGMINSVVGPLGNLVTAINLSPASGGENRIVSIVSEADMTALLNSVRAQLQSLAYEKMQTRITESQLIIIESIRIEEERSDWTAYSAEIGTVTDELSLTMRAVVSAMVVDDHFGQQVTLARLSAQKPLGTKLRRDSITYTRGPIIRQESPSRFAFRAASGAKVMPELDAAQLQARLAGLSLDEARDILASQPELSRAAPAQILLRPAGFGRMPLLPVRIDIQIQEPA